MKQLLTWMQINHYPVIYKRSWGWVLKLIVTLCCGYFIYTKCSAAWNTVDFHIPGPAEGFWPLMCVVMLLMCINWSLEAIRWRQTIFFERVSFAEALGHVLGGLALNWVLPLTTGDLVGRLGGRRDLKRSAIAVGVNRGLMLLITCLYGGVSVFFYFQIPRIYTVIIVLILGLLLSILFSRKKAKAGLLTGLYSTRQVMAVAALSVLRYVVFVGQFFLILHFFNPELPVDVTVWGIGWIFLFRSLVPALLGNFGIREASAIVFFEPYVATLFPIVFSCLLIWMVNTVIPSLAGLAAIYHLGSAEKRLSH